MAGYQYREDVSSIMKDLDQMTADLKDNIKSTMQDIASELKSNVETAMPKEKGKPKHGIHMADDVKSSVSVKDKRATATVKGGKQTGSLWFIVDNGHVAKNGKFVGGAHFTDKAYANTDVESKVDELLSKVAE